eukprot:scaffold108933_cov31-Tisochrysis_lutea.AAC.2
MEFDFEARRRGKFLAKNQRGKNAGDSLGVMSVGRACRIIVLKSDTRVFASGVPSHSPEGEQRPVRTSNSAVWVALIADGQQDHRGIGEHISEGSGGRRVRYRQCLA